MQTLNLSHISSGSPTYWPSDCAKTPDLIDFCISIGMPLRLAVAESSLDLSSDHTPVVITLPTMASLKERPAVLHSGNTKNIVSNVLSTNLPLKTEYDVQNAFETFNNVIQNAAWNSTTAANMQNPLINLENMVEEQKKSS